MTNEWKLVSAAVRRLAQLALANASLDEENIVSSVVVRQSWNGRASGSSVTTFPANPSGTDTLKCVLPAGRARGWASTFPQFIATCIE